MESIDEADRHGGRDPPIRPPSPPTRHPDVRLRRQIGCCPFPQNAPCGPLSTGGSGRDGVRASAGFFRSFRFQQDAGLRGQLIFPGHPFPENAGRLAQDGRHKRKEAFPSRQGVPMARARAHKQPRRGS